MRTNLTLTRSVVSWIVLVLVAMLIVACMPGGALPVPGQQPAPTQPPVTPEPTSPAPSAAATAKPESQAPVPVPPADGSRPLAKLSPAERADRFSGPAPMSVKPNTIYVATIVTPKGNIVAELYQDTPESLNNFVTLAQNGFYDGLTFHRVEPGFVIQGGDPQGNGSGSPGYTIPAEIKHTHPRGALAWARTGDEVNPERRSSGSQFYITLADASFLNGGYTVFGQVIEGLDIVDKIAVGDKIERIDITTATNSRMPTPTPTPEPKAPVSEEGRPLAKLPVAQREKFYNTAPAVTIDPNKSYQATIKTDKGEIVLDLDAKTAPATVNSFVLLANLGFFDGMPVAYAQPNSYAVLGSPAGNPGSDVGYALNVEAKVDAGKIMTGTVSMWPVLDPTTGAAKASGSLFFISLAEQPTSTTPLNVFGKVTTGLDIANALKTGDVVSSITISEK